MKVCPRCNAQMEDNATFCTTCGERFANQQQNFYDQQQQMAYQTSAQGYPAYDPYDHTAEFDKKDISDNKVISMLVYLLGTTGIFIALLTGNTSPYAAFHVRQALKFTVVKNLMFICAVLLCWTFIVPIAYLVMLVVFWVIKIICFFQICSGKAKEPAIIRSLGFLK